MATIKGVWVWNASVNFTNSYSYLNLSCTSNNTAFDTISIEGGSSTVIKYNTNSPASTTTVYDNGSWSLDAYRTIDFGTTEYECPDEFYTEFTANAEPEETEYGNLKVYSNDGSSLLKTISIPTGTTVTFTVTNTGFSGGGYSYTYSGDKTFLGVATNANATTPTYAVGSTFSWTSTTAGKTFYIVEETTESEEPTDPEETTTEVATITYNGSTIANLEAGKTITLHTAGKKLIKDLIVKANKVTSGGSSGGECSGEHIIEVTELPTENIDENAVYKVDNSTICVDACGNGIPSVRNYLESMGVTFDIFNVDELPTENIMESNDASIYIYYIPSENVIYGYQDGTWNSFTEGGFTPIFGSRSYHTKATNGFNDVIVVNNGESSSLADVAVLDGSEAVFYRVSTKPTNTITAVSENVTPLYYVEDENDVFIYLMEQWVSLSQFYNTTFQGVISNASEATADGYYAIISRWDNYIPSSGGLAITKNGTFDVTDKARVIVNCPDAAVCGIWRFNEWLEDPGNDIEQVVNFTTIFEDGNEVECINMHFGGSGLAGDPYSTYFTTADGSIKTVWENTADDWNYDSARTVNFGTEPQLVTTEFKDFLTTNATPIYTITQTE